MKIEIELTEKQLTAIRMGASNSAMPQKEKPLKFRRMRVEHQMTLSDKGVSVYHGYGGEEVFVFNRGMFLAAMDAAIDHYEEGGNAINNCEFVDSYLKEER